ncbi:hypothetical protein P7C70_g826, partial [Phenoliferia sp. Uapishka_3]
MVSQQPPTKLAILGAGTWPKEAHLPALVNLQNKSILKAVYSRSEASATALATSAKEALGLCDLVEVYFEGSVANNLDALLASDVEGVIIALPIMKQPELIRRAWAAGKNVASEKPIAGDVQAAQDLYALFTEKYEPLGLKWHILENFVHEPAYVEARDLVSSNTIGKLAFFSYSVCFHVDTQNRFYQTEWRTKPSHEGGFLLDGGVHHSAALHLCLPSAPTEISAFASLHKGFLAPSDTLHSIIKTEDGAVGTFEISFASSSTHVREELTLVGSTGHIKVSAITAGARQAGFTVDLVGAQTQSMFFESRGVEKASLVDKTRREITDRALLQAIECFVDALRGTASEDQLIRASAPRATKDVAFILTALNSHGSSMKL